MQSDLLGAHSMGIRNLLIITGDPPRVGDYPDATAVYDVDSIGLTNVVARLNRGLDIGEQPIGQPTAFHIGVALNPGAHDMAESFAASNTSCRRAPSSRLRSRSSMQSFGDVLRQIGGAPIPILAGIMPLESLRHAEFMANEVPGVHVPDAIVERMRKAESDGRAQAEGISDCARGGGRDPSARAGIADIDSGRRGGRGPPGDGGGDVLIRSRAVFGACPPVPVGV